MAVESNVGGTRNPCAHPTTARSAKDSRVWVCLYCGMHLSSTAQLVLGSEPNDLPEPPVRR